jgi:hypothetical protein
MNYHSKIFEAKVDVGEPTDGDLALINGFAKRRLTADEVYVASMHLANTAVDRSFERFPVSYLEQFKDTIVGKSLLIGHDHRAAPEGLFFKAEVMGEHGAQSTEPEARSSQPGAHLKAWFYVVKTKQNEHLRAQVDGGVYRYVSIGFQYEDLVCDICGQSLFSRECPHVPGRDYDGKTGTATYAGNAEAVEGSIVYLGAQYGAELLKARAARDARRMAIIKDERPLTADCRLPTRDGEREIRAGSVESDVPGLMSQVSGLRSEQKHGDALDKDSPWDWDWTRDANATIEDLGWEGLKRACAWVDTSESTLPKRKGAYKLPHAKLKGGVLTVYYRGVVAAMAALLGARGGVDIPDKDRRSVYLHLASHYREFGEEPPALGSAEHAAESREVRVESRGSSAEAVCSDDGSSSKIAELEVSLSVANRLVEEQKERIAELEPLAEDGKLYRDTLLAEIRRLAVAVGQDVQGALAAEALFGADCKTISCVVEEYRKLFDERFPPQPQAVPVRAANRSKQTDPSEYA